MSPLAAVADGAESRRHDAAASTATMLLLVLMMWFLPQGSRSAAPDSSVRGALGDEFSRPRPSHLRHDGRDDVMGTYTRLEELGMSGLGEDAPGTAGLGEVDEPAFTGLAERHRRELHVHCY